MNELIDKLSSYVESQFGEEKKTLDLNSVSAQNKNTFKSSSNTKLNEGSKRDTQSEIHNAMAELYSDVDKIAEKSFGIDSKKMGKSSTVKRDMVHKGTLEQKNGNQTISHDIELHKKKEEYSRNNMIYRPCCDKNANTFEKMYTRETLSRPLKDHMGTVNRLYETQCLYDKRLEVSKFLCAQNELRHNKKHPVMNSKSKELINKFGNWKPLYKRTGEIIEHSKQKLHEKREEKEEEMRRQEEQEIELIQNQQVHKTNKKMNKYDWERYYNGRFMKHLKDKEKRIKELDERWNKPNQAVPVVNKSPVRNVSVGAVVKVEDRMFKDFADRKLKLEKLKRDLTPNFKPRINRTSKSILERSASKSARYRTNQDAIKYNSISKISNFIQNQSYDHRNIKEFVKEFHKDDSKESRKQEQYNTVGHTDGTYDSFNFVSRQQQDDFKSFLDSYEKNVSNAIQIEQELNTDLLKGAEAYRTRDEEPLQSHPPNQMQSMSFNEIEEERQEEPIEEQLLEENVDETDSNAKQSEFESNPDKYQSNKSENMKQIESLYEEGQTGSSGKEHPIIEEMEDDHGSPKENESKILSKEEQDLLDKINSGSAQSVQNNLSQLYEQLKNKLNLQESSEGAQEEKIVASASRQDSDRFEEELVSLQVEKKVKNIDARKRNSYAHAKIQPVVEDLDNSFRSAKRKKSNFQKIKNAPGSEYEPPNSHKEQEEQSEGQHAVHAEKAELKSENAEMQKLRELAQQFQQRRASQAVKPAKSILEHSSKLSSIVNKSEHKSEKETPHESDKISQKEDAARIEISNVDDRVEREAEEEGKVTEDVVVLSKEEHQKLLDQIKQLEELRQQANEQSFKDKSVKDDSSHMLDESANNDADKSLRFTELESERSAKNESQSRRKSKQRSKKSRKSTMQENQEISASEQLHSQREHAESVKGMPSVPKISSKKQIKRGSVQPSKPPIDNLKPYERKKTMASQRKVESTFSRKQDDEEETKLEKPLAKKTVSNRSWISKCEALEARVEQMLKEEPEEESERSVQKRILLEKLLSFAVSESRSAKESDVSSSDHSFNIPQSILDELEELGVDTMKLINGIMDQYSYLFTKRKGKKKTKKAKKE